MDNLESKEPSPELLKEWREEPLCQDGARAMETLVEKGCEPHLIEGYLRRIVSHPDLGVAPFFLFAKRLYHVNRQLRDLPQQIRKLADRLEKLRAIPAVWERLLKTRSITAHAELRKIADRLAQASELRAGAKNLHREPILDLLDLVKTTTGRYHYAEVATLINASYCWQAVRHGRQIPDPAYDVDALKMMVHRANRALAPKTAHGPTSSRRPKPVAS